MRSNGAVTLNVIANESVYSISGKASIQADRMEGVPLKLALVEIAIEEVRDVMFLWFQNFCRTEV
ncbi:hypothetical protein GCM10020331_044860 [Ectobacillus funiculus]